MTSAHGRPTAAELIGAVAEFLETDVRESTAGQVNFHARVAANALRIVERELLADAEATVVGSKQRMRSRWVTAPRNAAQAESPCLLSTQIFFAS